MNVDICQHLQITGVFAQFHLTSYIKDIFLSLYVQYLMSIQAQKFKQSLAKANVNKVLCPN